MNGFRGTPGEGKSCERLGACTAEGRSLCLASRPHVARRDGARLAGAPRRIDPPVRQSDQAPGRPDPRAAPCAHRSGVPVPEAEAAGDRETSPGFRPHRPLEWAQTQREACSARRYTDVRGAPASLQPRRASPGRRQHLQPAASAARNGEADRRSLCDGARRRRLDRGTPRSRFRRAHGSAARDPCRSPAVHRRDCYHDWRVFGRRRAGRLVRDAVGRERNRGGRPPWDRHGTQRDCAGVERRAARCRWAADLQRVDDARTG